MRTLWLLFIAGCLCPCTILGQSSRVIVDDDQFIAQVVESGLKLLEAGKLLPQQELRAQVQNRRHAFKLLPVARRKLEPTELFEQLRASTLAVGVLYKCADCGEWHFNSSAGFVAAEGGVVSTCCHVLLEQDPETKNGYLLAADAEGHVFPVRRVLAADTEADTCFLQVEGRNLKPLPFRSGARTGERVFCLSHPGGYYFMFTQGMIARVNRRPNELPEEAGSTNTVLTRPILFLNITAEFAPGSSGAPIVDEAGNVVGQVASIADAGDPEPGDAHKAPSPSVPVRFCTAAEEITRLAQTDSRERPTPQLSNGTPARSSPHSHSSARPQSPEPPPSRH